MPFALEPGREVGGRYTLDRPLGEGGMGQVWAARETATLRPVALKFLKGDSSDSMGKRRLLREARASCAVKHPAVVAVQDVIESDVGEPALVMELLVGEPLTARIARDKPMSPAATGTLLLPVAEALAAAHAVGIVHRDLKPDNLFISTDGTVRVLDFGIAKRVVVDEETASSIGTQTGTLIGTPIYMSPEQACGDGDIDHRTDIWSLGLILYQCLTGVLPTMADNLGLILKILLTSTIRPLRELAPNVPAELASLVDKMLDSNRSTRLDSMVQVASVLSAYAKRAEPHGQLVVRVSDSDSGDAWAVTQTPDDEREAAAAATGDTFMRLLAATSMAGPVQPEPDRTGQRISHYQVVRKVGQGGMGIVYAANDVRLRRRVALKVLPVAVIMSADRRSRFLREARSASAVQHPNVATVFDVGESEEVVFLAMEYVDGPTLRKLLESNGGKLEPLKALAIALQIARGLARAHEAGVIHRDVKPENVMIAADGTIKVLDFGLAKLAGSSDDAGASVAEDDVSEEFASRSGHVLGTPAYMSPEQAAGGVVDARTDIYAMGVVLHEMLLGSRPVKGNRGGISSGSTRLGVALTRIIDRCLSPLPEGRYADAGALSEELSRVQATLTLGRTRRWWPIVVASAVVTAAVGAFTFGPLAARPSAAALSPALVPYQPRPNTTQQAAPIATASASAPTTPETSNSEPPKQPATTASIRAAAASTGRPAPRASKARTADPLSQQK